MGHTLTFLRLAALGLCGSLLMAGCDPDGPFPAFTANFDRGKVACAALHTAVARARCFNRVVNGFVRPTVRDQDLLSFVEAERVALAEQVDAGKMTQAEADLRLGRTRSVIFSEAQRRADDAYIAGALTIAAMPLRTWCDSYDNGVGLTMYCY